MNKYPLSLSAYYLDFSYPGHITLETRFFINIPFSGQELHGNKKISLLELCFDMNSTFNKEGYKSKDDIELGLTVQVATKFFDLPKTNSFDYLKKQLIDGSEKVKEDFGFNSEKDLYESLMPLVKRFLTDVYSKENWIKFTEECFVKLEKRKIHFNEEEKQSYLASQPQKIENFINETLNRLELILKATVLNEEFFNKYRISIKPHERSIVNQIMNSVDLEELTPVIELNNFSKTYQYYSLSNELPINESNSKPKTKI